MNQLLNISEKNASTLTMSSKEIADLCEKQHAHVLRDIRNMLNSLYPNMDSLDFKGIFAVKNEYGLTSEILLPKREVMILVSGYRIDLRAKIIDRLDELENQQKLPQNYLQALEALVESEKQKQALAIENQAMKPKAEFVDRYVDIKGLRTITEVSKILKIKRKDLINSLICDKALYRQNGALLPYQDKLERGYFEVKTGSANDTYNYSQTLVTGLGIEWIAKRYATELM